MVNTARQISDLTYSRDIKAIHAMKRELALAEESYRALVSKASNARTDSSASLEAAERDRLLDDLRRLGAGKKKPGHRPHDSKPTSGKLLALWISAYHLGIVRDKTDKGLAAFVKRQMGVDDLRFHNSGEAHKAIEALKDWMSREGLVYWNPKRTARACVIYAQWDRLRQLGAFTKTPADAKADFHALCNFMWRCVGRVCTPDQLDDTDADKAIVKLGSWIRSQVKKNAGL